MTGILASFQVALLLTFTHGRCFASSAYWKTYNRHTIEHGRSSEVWVLFQFSYGSCYCTRLFRVSFANIDFFLHLSFLS
jgi:hypothetical protein